MEKSKKAEENILLPSFVKDENDNKFWQGLSGKEKQSAILAEQILKTSFNLKKSNAYKEFFLKLKESNI